LALQETPRSAINRHSSICRRTSATPAGVKSCRNIACYEQHIDTSGTLNIRQVLLQLASEQNVPLLRFAAENSGVHRRKRPRRRASPALAAVTSE